MSKLTIMRRLLILGSVFLSLSMKGQIVENFSDGDFSDGNPFEWVTSQSSGGDDFIIVSEELQSNGPSDNGDLFFSTNLGIDFTSNDVIWTFKARYEGGEPSNNNKIQIYLISDIADVTDNPQGYYLDMGESGSDDADGIDFFKTGSNTPLINDDNDLIGAGINVHIRVSRTSTGEWILEADAAGGDSFVEVGRATDTDFTAGDFFGFYVSHTQARRMDYFFDDFTLTVTPIPDTTPPTIEFVTPVSATEVDIQFSENVDEVSSENVANYAINNGINISDAVRDLTDNSIVHLTTSSLTNGQDYTITINNIEDQSNNVIESNTSEEFRYIVLEEAIVGDIVVNEFMTDPNPPVGLPEAEFIELFNTSDKFIDMNEWTIDDVNNESAPFPEYVFAPDSYLILCSIGDVSLFEPFGNVLGVSSFPDLTISNNVISLKNDTDIELYSISYSQSANDGVTTELINPNGPDYSENNYGPSIDLSGGTPGQQNSIFDDTPDTTSPLIVSIDVVSDTELNILFDELMDEGTAEDIANYSIDGGISIVAAILNDADRNTVTLTVSTLTSGEDRILMVSGVQDLSGNQISNTSLDFKYLFTEAPEPLDIVINEFLADPTPSIGLPEVEFIELYNTSTKNLNLLKWEVSDSPLGNYILEPNQYLIVVDDGSVEQFAGFSEVVSIPSLSLSNSEDEIILKDSIGTTIHNVNYEGSEEGISRELINPNPVCAFEYIPSVSTNGGTPGVLNSVFRS
ncbi:MAG: lamin tail domain-containing protein, partial [Bacteroidota bacterium]